MVGDSPSARLNSSGRHVSTFRLCVSALEWHIVNFSDPAKLLIPRSVQRSNLDFCQIALGSCAPQNWRWPARNRLSRRGLRPPATSCHSAPLFARYHLDNYSVDSRAATLRAAPDRDSAGSAVTRHRRSWMAVPPVAPTGRPSTSATGPAVRRICSKRRWIRRMALSFDGASAF